MICENHDAEGQNKKDGRGKDRRGSEGGSIGGAGGQSGEQSSRPPELN